MKEPQKIELPDQTPLLTAVGRGIQSFSNIEGMFGILFASLMTPADRGSSVLALDAIRNIETKLQVVQAVVDYKLKGDDLAEGRKLINTARKRIDIRNKLAHWTVTYWPGISAAKDFQKVKVVLAPSPFSKIGGAVMWAPETTDVQPLTFEEVEMFAHQCTTLALSIAVFSSKLSPAPKDGGKNESDV